MRQRRSSTVSRARRLHAFMLAFEHPTSGETMHFESPVPDDMKELVDALRG